MASLSHVVEQLIEELRGTPESADTVLDTLTDGEYDSLLDLPMEFLQQIDDSIFQCTACSWWCDIDEANDQNGENVCNDCHEED